MAVKFFNFNNILVSAKAAFLRFPMVIISAVIGSLSLIVFYELSKHSQNEQLFEIYPKITMICWLAVPLFLSASLIAERYNYNLIKSWLINFFCIAFLLLYFFILPLPSQMNYTDIARFILYGLALHLFVSYIPFINTENSNGFWQFNKSLFLRFLTASLYSFTLFMGLSAALLSINQLLGISIKDNVYFDLYVIMCGVFNTYFFIAGVPKNIHVLESDTSYPKGLKLFTTYVLIPLVTIYLLILYLYMTKIIFLWSLPKGWVAWLTIGFSIFGILSLLLVHPLKNSSENIWIKIYAKWFYRSLFPLVILLFVSIGTRIYHYGITENRYFVLVLALWLLGISIYFLFSKSKHIKWLPISLSILCVLTSIGPWSAFSVSETSQVKRFKTILQDAHLLKNDKIIINKTKIKPDSVCGELYAHVSYLINNHGVTSLQPLITVNLDSLCKDSKNRYDKIFKITSLIGIEDCGYRGYAGVKEYFNYYTKTNNETSTLAIPYEFLATNLNNYAYNSKENTNIIFYKGSQKDSMALIMNNSVLTATYHQKNLIRINLTPIVQEVKLYYDKNKKSEYDYAIPQEKMIHEFLNDSIAIKLIIQNISGTMHGGNLNIDNINYHLLFRIKGIKNDTLQ